MFPKKVIEVVIGAIGRKIAVKRRKKINEESVNS